MEHDDLLKKYREKRDFQRTAEPSGGGEKKISERPIFVIQKHDASHLHYDFRLEVEGVLKSWAVPKGPSTDPHDKRLAVPTEDHPLEYAHFEGVIPKEEYGGGTVLVWDAGTYRNLRMEKAKDQTSMEQAIEQGKIEVWLEGKKLQGGYALVRSGKPDKSGRERWLLIKKRDEHADEQRNPTMNEPQSILTGRTIEQIRSAEDQG